jgi:hypothetical protein
MLKAGLMVPLLLRLADDAHVTAAVFERAPEVTSSLTWTLFTIWIASALMFTLGWRLSVTGTVLAACLIVTLGLDLQAYSNHLYLMTWLVLLLVVADAGAGRSLHPTGRMVASWTLFLPMLQISIVYAFSGLTKLNEEFLSGGVLASVVQGGTVTLPDALRTPPLMAGLSVAAVFIEVFIAFALWIPGVQRIAFVLGGALHLSITLLMQYPGDLLVFSALMISAYPLFAQVRSTETELRPATA